MIDLEATPFREYTVRRGRHWSWPLRLRFGLMNYKPEEEITVIHPQDSVYIHMDENGGIHPDQWDWNKVLGRKFRVRPHVSTYMVASRYNPATRLFEYTTYIHKDERVILGDGSTIGANILEDMSSPFTVTASEAKKRWWDFVAASKPLATREPGQALLIRELAMHGKNEYGFAFPEDNSFGSEKMDTRFFWLKTHPWFGGNKVAPVDWRVLIKNW